MQCERITVHGSRHLPVASVFSCRHRVNSPGNKSLFWAKKSLDEIGLVVGMSIAVCLSTIPRFLLVSTSLIGFTLTSAFT